MGASDPSPLPSLLDALQIVSTVLKINAAIAIIGIGNEKPILVIRDGGNRKGKWFVSIGDGVGINFDDIWLALKNSGKTIDLTDFVLGAILFHMGFDLWQILGQDIQQKWVHYILEFNSLLEIQQHF